MRKTLYQIPLYFISLVFWKEHYGEIPKYENPLAGFILFVRQDNVPLGINELNVKSMEER